LEKSGYAVTDRVLEIAETPAKIKLHLDCLCIETQRNDPMRVPVEEIGLLLLANPSVQISAAALQYIAKAGGSVLLCDEKCLPIAELLPLQNHSLHSERLRKQIEAKEPLKKRLWQQIVQAKLKAQGALLQRLWGMDHGLTTMARLVRSGDADNLEGQGARKYWAKLFGDIDFVRDREASDQNRFLNYGYAIVRAQVARAICSTGLNPSLGLHHHNRYDAFPLADDLIEPFRTFVDEKVVEMLKEHDPMEKMTSSVRRELIGVLHRRVDLNGESLLLSHAIQKCAQGLAAIILGEKTGRLVFPAP
jgi:CRISPR-associated protein Cas1